MKKLTLMHQVILKHPIQLCRLHCQLPLFPFVPGLPSKNQQAKTEAACALDQTVPVSLSVYYSRHESWHGMRTYPTLN